MRMFQRVTTVAGAAALLLVASGAMAQIEAGKNLGKAMGKSLNNTANKMSGSGGAGGPAAAKNGMAKTRSSAVRHAGTQERYRALHAKHRGKAKGATKGKPK